jgi:isopenicillin N synthase-like dioxygenase
MIVGGQSLDVAELEVIRLERVVAKDPLEMAKVLKAAESQGFFYVTFNDDLSETISSYLQACYLSSHEYFSKPLEEKMKAFREGVIHGYVNPW